MASLLSSSLASSFAWPSAVFAGVRAFAGRPVVVFGSRALPRGALLSVARFGRWVAGLGSPVWSGAALGADVAASAGALAAGGSVRWWLPASVGELASAPVGAPVVRGSGGAFPLCPASVRSVAGSRLSVVSWAGGRGSRRSRLFGRSAACLRACLASGGCVVVFVAASAWASGRGGSCWSVRCARRLGFVLGRSLFVVVVQGC